LQLVEDPNRAVTGRKHSVDEIWTWHVQQCIRNAFALISQQRSRLVTQADFDFFDVHGSSYPIARAPL
jgi:hypothetical protein